MSPVQLPFNLDIDNHIHEKAAEAVDFTQTTTAYGAGLCPKPGLLVKIDQLS